MHYVGYAEMAAAVSNAGGLGIITALTQPSPEDLRAEIKKCKGLTDKPFGVNLTILPMIGGADYPAIMKVIIEEGVKVVETAGRSPKDLVKPLKAAGVVIVHKCVSIKNALSAERLGVDMISMDGFDCAGHPGEEDVGNWVLLAKAGRVLTIPFLASGGVGTGEQLAAALAFGAEGVNMGTRFMATKEAPIHDNIKKALVEGNETDTTLVFRTLSNTERVYKNKQSEKVVEIENANPGDFSAIQPYVKGMLYKESFQKTGDTQDSVWSCGTVMGLIDDVPTCKELILRMMREYEVAVKRLPQAKL
jgi:nitronate monooxygenase